MKFKFYSLSALAIAALMTACSSEDELVQTPATGADAATPAISINLDELATRGFVSEKGAWTNFKANNNNVGDEFDARVTLMIYNTNNSNNPVVIAAPQYLTQAQAAASGDKVEFQPLRVPAGNSYTAVAYVDFVGKDHADKFYNVDNLNNVQMILANPDANLNGAAGAEMRDAYTGKVTFTLSPDGTTAQGTATAVDQIPAPNAVDAPEGQEATATEAANVSTLNILARRHFAKVRIVMTDYATKAEWMQYFKGEDPGRVFNAEAMKIKDLKPAFNALTQETISSTGADQVFMSEYNYQEPTINWVTIQASAAPTVDNYMDLLQETGMRGVSADLASAADDAIIFPVLSYNYLIPANQTDAAVYDIDFAALSKQGTGAYIWDNAVTVEPSTADWKTLMVRHINSVPVVKNTLTTIWGNFLTVETPTFIVTINDIFDNEVDRVLINDDSTTQTIITIAGVRVDIYRNADGKIVQVDVDKEENKITAENWNELMEGLQDLLIWVNEDDADIEGGSILQIFFNEYMKDNYDFLAGTDIGRINLIAEGTLADAYENTAITEDIFFLSNFDQPNIKMETSEHEIALMSDNTAQLSDIDLKAPEYVGIYWVNAKNVKLDAAVIDVFDCEIDGTLDMTDSVEGNITDSHVTGNTTVTGPATIYNSTFDANVDITGQATINESKVQGNLTVGAKAILTNVEVNGTTTLNGNDNVISGTKYDGTVTLNGTTIINSGTFNAEVIAKDALVVNDGTFNDNVRVFADATFNGGTVSTVNDKFVVAETPGTTLTMNAWVGNVCCGDAVVQTSQKVIITGTATENVPDYVAGKYTRYGLTNLGFIVQ